MRVLNWALDAQKTVGGKIISVILSVALIFSFSNFFYGDNAFADTEEDTKSELVDQVSDKPAEEKKADKAENVQKAASSSEPIYENATKEDLDKSTDKVVDEVVSTNNSLSQDIDATTVGKKTVKASADLAISKAKAQKAKDDDDIDVVNGGTYYLNVGDKVEFETQEGKKQWHVAVGHTTDNSKFNRNDDGIILDDLDEDDVDVIVSKKAKPGDKFTVRHKLDNDTYEYFYIIIGGEVNIKDYVTLTPANVEKIYDGTALAAGIATATDKSGKTVKVEYSIDGKTWTEDPAKLTATNVADSKTIKVRASVESAYNGYVTAEQKLKINKRDVTVTAKSDSKAFDGTALTNNGWDVAATTETTGLVKNDKIASVTVEGTITYVGTADNVAKDAVFAEGVNANNYNVKYEKGTLEVTDRADKYVITASAPDGEYTYDGDAKTAEGVAYDKLTFNGQTYTVEGLGSTMTQTDAGEYETAITGTAVVKAADGTDVTNQFSVNTEDKGLLKINKRDVTVTAKSDSKAFDGTALTNNGWDVAATTETTGLVKNDKIASVTVEGTITYVGTADNVAKDAVFAEGVNANNYNVKYEKGTLEVTDRADKYVITASAPDGEYTYDGDAKTAEGVAYDKLTFNGQTYTVEGLGSTMTQTDAGEYETAITGTAVVKAADGTDVTNQFSVNTEDKGLLKINHAEATVTAGNATKVYGTSDPSFEATVEGLVPADATNTSLIQYSIAREAGEDVGTYAITASGDGIQGNYKVTYAPGTLTIVPQSIDPNDPTQPTDPADPTTDPNQPVYNNAQVNNPENVVYNAQSQQQPIEVTDSEGNIIDPSNYTVDYTGAVNAGTVTVTITGQGNYAGSVTRTYQITPAPVTITVNDATKVAGAADPAFTGQVTEGQIYNNELGDITFTRTNGDQATGTYADVLTANYAANSNYAVTVVPGTFTITAAPAPAPAPAPTPTPAPAPAPATPAAAPAAPAAAPAAPAVVIPDEENPLAAPEQEIADDENPLAAFDHEECWVHWFMIAGIILTIIYGAVVVLRRTRNTKHIDKMEKDLIGTTDESTVTVGSAHHSHA